MTVAATGNFGKAAEALKNLVAASATFIAEQPDLITDGDFASDAGWTLGSGWTIAAGVASCDTSSAILSQTADLAITAGDVYTLTLDIDSAAAGSKLQGSLGGTGTAISTYAETGAVSVEMTAGSTDSEFVLQLVTTGGAPFEITIDDVVLRKRVSDCIFIGEYNPGTVDLLDCFAVIQRSSDVSGSVANTQYLNNGELMLFIEREIPAAYQAAESEPDAEQDFYNFLDAVIDECQTLSGSAGYLMTRSWSVNEMARIEKENRFFARITVAWGLATS